MPLSTILGEDSFSHTLDHSGASALLADVRVYGRFEATVSDHDLAYELAVELDDTGTRGRYTGPDRHLGGYAPYVGPNDECDPVGTATDKPAIVVYTSGTSGKPKDVVQTHQYLLGALPSYQCWFHCFGTTHRERVWTPAEWAWAGALFDVVFPTLAMGVTVVSRVRRSGFDPECALELVECQEISRAFMPPTALWQIRRDTEPVTHDLGTLEVVMCGDKKLSAPLAR